MDVQQLIDDVEVSVGRLDDVESNVEDKLNTLEDIRDRTTDTRSTLQSHLESLLGLEEAINEAEAVISDAEEEGVG